MRVRFPGLLFRCGLTAILAALPAAAGPVFNVVEICVSGFDGSQLSDVVGPDYGFQLTSDDPEDLPASDVDGLRSGAPAPDPEPAPGFAATSPAVVAYLPSDADGIVYTSGFDTDSAWFFTPDGKTAELSCADGSAGYLAGLCSAAAAVSLRPDFDCALYAGSETSPGYLCACGRPRRMLKSPRIEGE